MQVPAFAGMTTELIFFFMLKIHLLTLFPGMFDSFLSHSIVKRAIDKKKASILAHNLRDWTHDRHKTCDDKPFGGGPGMLMKPEPVFEAYDDIFGKKKRGKGFRFICLSAQGERFDQKKARELSRCKELALLCGHYEGMDQRIVDTLATEEISIGDYVLTGGEVAAMVIADAVVRLLPGVVGCAESTVFESFTQNLLEYPQYTRPAVYRGMAVPPVLLSGNHRKIEEWQKSEALKRTFKRRPDLLILGGKKT